MMEIRHERKLRCRLAFLLSLATSLLLSSMVMGSSLRCTSTTASKGDTAVAVTIVLANAQSYAGFDLSIGFDSQKLKFRRIQFLPRLAGQSGAGYRQVSSDSVECLSYDGGGAVLAPDSSAILTAYFDVPTTTHDGVYNIVMAGATAVNSTLAYDNLNLQNGSIQVGCCVGTTGNVNGIGVVDLADLSALVSYLTGGGFHPPCMDAANVDGKGIVDLGDLSALVAYLTGAGFTLPSCP